jgi:soluble lytic murein transglycosylase-like protein
MYDARWIIKPLFAKTPERRGLIAFSLIGWLLMFAVIAKMFLGCSANFHQAAIPFKTHFFEVSTPPVTSADAAEKIALSSCYNGSLSFLWPEFVVENKTPAYVDNVMNDLWAIARIGTMPTTAPVETVKMRASVNRSAVFHPVINRAAALYQVDPALVQAIIFAESGYNPSAVSKRGAMGLMQLMPGTAKAMGVKDCFDPEHNIYGGVKYFKKLVNQFDGDVELALAAYNAGSRKVREFNGIPPYRATEHYIQKVLKYYNIYKSQQAEPVSLS